uniref:Uncharacterized protein n=1 Tax=Rousettus aegyptiacus TaxID=9407 RepID=A0A7J8BRN8_ROUAE|nr:hypothetical protein HJG63_009514 [Rousettus aegyptiacus]
MQITLTSCLTSDVVMLYSSFQRRGRPEPSAPLTPPGRRPQRPGKQLGGV